MSAPALPCAIPASANLNTSFERWQSICKAADHEHHAHGKRAYRYWRAMMQSGNTWLDELTVEVIASLATGYALADDFIIHTASRFSPEERAAHFADKQGHSDGREEWGIPAQSTWAAQQ